MRMFFWLSDEQIEELLAALKPGGLFKLVEQERRARI